MKTPLYYLVILSTIFFLSGCGNSDSGSERTSRETANPVNDAYKVCNAFERTGLTTQCEVSGWNSTIDVTIDTTGAEARKMCPGIVDMVAKLTRSFAGKWKLQIFSPYSGERPIAVCRLR